MKKTINPRTKIIAAMIIWGTLGLFVRRVELSSLEIAFFRAFIGSVFLILVSLITKGKIDRKTLMANKPMLITSGIILGLNWIALFQAMKYTTISNATLSYYFAPVFIVILSAILLKEKLTVKNLLYLMVAILGLVLIVKSGKSEFKVEYNHLKGIIYGLMGAVLYALVVILNKQIKGISSFHTTLVQLSISTIVLIPVIIATGSIDFRVIDIKTWALIFILGVVHTGVAYLLYFSSIQKVKSQTTAILSYLDPIVAILGASLFLGESMTAVQILGGVLILITSYMSEKGESDEIKCI